MGKKDRHTIFNTIRQLQRLPRLLTDRERNILQLIPVIRDMFSCFSVCASALILTLLPNLIPISLLIPFPTHLHLHPHPQTTQRAENSHAPIQTLHRDLRPIMVTRQRNLAMFFRLYSIQHPHPQHNSYTQCRQPTPPSPPRPSHRRTTPRHIQLFNSRIVGGC